MTPSFLTGMLGNILRLNNRLLFQQRVVAAVDRGKWTSGRPFPASARSRAWAAVRWLSKSISCLQTTTYRDLERKVLNNYNDPNYYVIQELAYVHQSPCATREYRASACEREA
jgi:hypothetical protein